MGIVLGKKLICLIILCLLAVPVYSYKTIIINALKLNGQTSEYYMNVTETEWNRSINITGNTTSPWFKGNFNWTTTDEWSSFDGSVFDFNESQLSTTYYNASTIEVVTGTGSGTIDLLQVYDQITYNVTEANSDIDFRVNFTGITEFTTLIIRHKTDADAGHISAIQIWDYNTETWEGYGYLTESTTSEIKTLGVYDDTDHIEDGVVQVRFYHVDVGNRGHVHQFDWVAISKGYGTPVGQEIDPLSIHRDGNTSLSGNWNVGNWNITGYDWLVCNESDDNYNDSYIEKTNSTINGLVNNQSYLTTANDSYILKTNSTIAGLVNNQSYLTTANDSYILKTNSTIAGLVNNQSYLTTANETYQNSTRAFYFDKTPDTYDGDALGSYSDSNDICNANFTGTHMCSVNEILDTIIYKEVTDIISWNGTVWINGGPPGYLADANDCLGWTSASNQDLGRFWDFDDTTDDGISWLINCANSKALSCCKNW